MEPQLDFWEGALGSGPFLEGSAVMRRLDIAFFGQLQMTFSGLSEGLVERVAARPALLAYIERMNAAFVDYPFNCYTRRVANGRGSTCWHIGGAGERASHR